MFVTDRYFAPRKRAGDFKRVDFGGLPPFAPFAENIATNEITFVQVKSRAPQRVLDDYVQRFQLQRERYDRMIFAVHSPEGDLTVGEDKLVQVWKGDRLAQLAVQVGLGEWIASRL